MSSPIRTLLEIVRLYRKGFRPVEFVRDADRISLHPSGWRANGSGRFKTADDAIEYLESAKPEQWRQIYCGMTPFLVSDKGNVKHVDGSAVKMNLANGRYQIMYKPEDPRGRGRDGRTHKKRVYRSMLVAMAWLDFRKGDVEHEIHHVNGYRTDDRVANLMVVDHDEHMRIHNLGPCGLSGMPDERIVDAPAACDGETGGADEPETYAGSHVALKPASDNRSEAPKKKRRRGKRGGKGRAAAQDAQAAGETQDAHDEDAAKRSDADGGTPQGKTPQAHDSHEEHGATPSAAPDATEKPRNENARRSRKEKPKREGGGNAAAKPETATDWKTARAALSDAVEEFLDAVGAHDAATPADEKAANKAAKPVYKALKPFATCPDAIESFDAALTGIRTVARAYAESAAAVPAPVHSMLGTMHQTVKESVKRIVNEGDALETQCLRELLCDEAAKPLFKKTPHARKFRQCISIVDSRNEKASENA